MVRVNTLEEIPIGDYEPLLEDLKQDFPKSIHAWSFLRSIERWKTYDPTLNVKILALNGDYRSRFILFYSANQNFSDIRASAHKWSHDEKDIEVVQEALRNYKAISWHAAGQALFTAMTEETNRVVTPVVKELDWVSQTEDFVVYWIPKEDALKLKFEVPKGTYIVNLTADHAKEVDENWAYRYNGSLELIESVLQFNFGLGLFDSKTHELMAWVLHWFYGGIGALHTKEHHRRKGYGSVVLNAITREVAMRGYDAHLSVLPDNVASRALVENSNYRLVFMSTWAYTRRISKQ